jgi:CIC family chloride channel protein
MKVVATVVSYASGNPGGVFAPTLYIGAMTGAVVGILIGRIAPFVPGDPGALTSVFMIFELTQDYQIIVPLMVANLLSFYLSRRFQPLPLYHALLEQDHVHLPSAVARSGDETWTAEHVMSADMRFIDGEMSVTDAAAWLSESGDQAALIGNADTFKGIVGRDRLREAVDAGRGDAPVTAVIETPGLHAHPDHPLAVVVERLAHSEGIIPIVSRTDATSVLGVVTVEGIMRGLRGHGKNGLRQQVGGSPASASNAGRPPGPEEARRPS